LDVFVKMDIEGCEYEVLPFFRPYFHLINGFAVEFHNLAEQGGKFTEAIKGLATDFYVAHAHANNGCGYISGTALPNNLEVTFISKQLVDGTPAYVKGKYPLAGLDRPCITWLADLSMEF
jgi:hypothetical protein